MIKQILPSGIWGTIMAPASKSYAQRALAAALLARGSSIIRNPSRCHDALSAMEVIENLGARIEDEGSLLRIEGGFKPKSGLLNFGEAGLGIRLFSAIAALHDQEMILSGQGSLMNRPMGLIEEAMKGLGVQCETREGFLPIKIKGPIAGGSVRVNGSLSSQVLSGLLMALPLAEKDSNIQVENLKSIPYIDMTLEIMDRFGVGITNENYESFFIPGRQSYQAQDYTVEGDWSGAAFLLVAGALAGQVLVTELHADSSQADKEILNALKQCGAHLEIQKDRILCGRSNLFPFSMDATHCPDLFPPLAALAAHCHGESRIRGVSRLIHKESNRADALLAEMGKLGVAISVEEDEMVIQGPAVIREARIDSHNDHRIAMAAAVTALPGQQPIEILGAECINKSYPEFYLDIKRLGGANNE